MKKLAITLVLAVVGCGEPPAEQLKAKTHESSDQSAEILALRTSSQSAQTSLEQLSMDLSKLVLRFNAIGASSREQSGKIKEETRSRVATLEHQIRTIQEGAASFRDAISKREAREKAAQAKASLGRGANDEKNLATALTWQEHAVQGLLRKITVHISHQTKIRRLRKAGDGPDVSPVRYDEIRASVEEMKSHLLAIVNGLEAHIEESTTKNDGNRATYLGFLKSLKLQQWESIALTKDSDNKTMAERLFYRLETKLFPSNPVSPATYDVLRREIFLAAARQFLMG